MKIGAPKESEAGEDRVAMTPASAKDLQNVPSNFFKTARFPKATKIFGNLVPREERSRH